MVGRYEESPRPPAAYDLNRTPSHMYRDHMKPKGPAVKALAAQLTATGLKQRHIDAVMGALAGASRGLEESLLWVRARVTEATGIGDSLQPGTDPDRFTFMDRSGYGAAHHGLLFMYPEGALCWVSFQETGVIGEALLEEAWPGPTPGQAASYSFQGFNLAIHPAERVRVGKDRSIVIPLAAHWSAEEDDGIYYLRLVAHDADEHAAFAAAVAAQHAKDDAAVVKAAALKAGRVGAPPQRPIRSARDAEQAAADHLAWLGFTDAAVTRTGTDEGVDVAGRGIIAQVKAQASPVGRPVVQQTYGVAMAEGAVAVVFGLGGFTPEALKWAARVGVALFAFDLLGAAEPLNDHARQLAPGDGKR